MYLHYHLEVQANPNKIEQKKFLLLASMGEKWLTHCTFKKILKVEKERLIEFQDFRWLHPWVGWKRSHK